MAYESSVMEGSGISVLRAGLRPGFPGAVPGVRGSNVVLQNYEDINSKLGQVQTSGLIVTTSAVHVAGPATRLRSRRQLRIQNLGAPAGISGTPVLGNAYIGGDNSVTISNGLQIPSGAITTLDVLDIGDIYIISAGTSDVRILELR